MFQHIFPLRGIRQQKRLHIGQDGLFAQVVADDRRHVGVDRLVIGDARSHRVGQRYAAGAICIEQSRYSETGISPEAERIEKIVVHSPIDNIHALESGGGAHVDDVVVHQEIPAFDQLDAHLLRQKGVFKVCRIKYSGGQQHHRRLVPRGGVQRAQRPQSCEQRLRIMLDRRNSVVAEQCGEHFLQNLAVRQHVGDAARYAEIVFQDGKASVWKTHQAGAADADVNPARHRKIAHLTPEVAATVDQFPGYDAIRQNSSAVVNVLQKKIQRRDSLGEPTFALPPFVVGTDSGEEIIRKDAHGALVVPVYREGDSLVQKRKVRRLLALAHFLGRQLQKGLEKSLIVRPRNSRGLEHLIVGQVDLVIPEWRPKKRARRLRYGHGP